MTTPGEAFPAMSREAAPAVPREAAPAVPREAAPAVPREVSPAVLREAELVHAVRGLRDEWAYWAELAGTEPMAKHTSQIEAITRLLGAGLDRADTFELVLDLFHVWDFFRAKLLLRRVGPLSRILAVADELAWAVYRPSVLAAGVAAGRKEPPLVFLDRGAVPFAAARGAGYRDLLPRGVRTTAGLTAVRELPVPVIGIPWYLTGHLPGVLLVAHEAGHHVEDDCGLTADLPAALAGLDAGTAARWTPWLGEAFADVVATVACGPAYPMILAEALRDAGDGAGAESYPPPADRLDLCRGAAGDDRTDSPAGSVGHRMATARYAGLGDRSLRDVLTHPDVARAEVGAAGLLRGLGSALTDVRAVLPAAALAFLADPPAYDTMRVDSRAVDEILALRPRGPRAGNDPAAAEARDLAAAQSLVKALS
ncbi:Proteoglycan 4 [Actinoplanes sp. SE50]|uniref:hypothetical protein n=1 Tax=unclassified Actinoplanes TaxID=2626549 RepID=UPI00023EBEB2|nr:MULTISPECIES: hypothetical protein [unclassified Actinoplanes]AEV82928.1 Proteoglycan 4 [Actinoplanes sp. SE50/110]ATO81324.1 Proteoglycan 4 [Actinoplanes sp. SE50]SLL98731.1 hypothetical protein ACSP50_1958 [Actinoplanes sp. SE50/110]